MSTNRTSDIPASLLNALSQYDILSSQWARKHAKAQEKLWKSHKKHIDAALAKPRQLAAGSMAGLLMLSQPVPSAIVTQAVQQIVLPSESTTQPSTLSKDTLIAQLSSALPSEVISLTDEQEDAVATILTNHYGVVASPSYEGKRLNRSYGLIGAEQHLMRYPGDTMATHFNNADDAQKYYSSGMAPGRGAWGYFAPSAQEMTQHDIEREKWYIAVPTFLSPTWKNDVNMHYQFFKYRKMLVVNPENGKAVVADIGDAGPAPSTGKHLGGSPEVMKHLERVDGRAKGPVLYFFIRDPQDSIPLGPIEPGNQDVLQNQSKSIQ